MCSSWGCVLNGTFCTRKQDKLQGLQNRSLMNLDNMDNTRREDSRTYRTEKRISERQN
jgi:hypothetical protein